MAAYEIESKDLLKEAHSAFKVSGCYACPFEKAGIVKGHRFEGWRVRFEGTSVTVIGYGKCAAGHDVFGSCAV